MKGWEKVGLYTQRGTEFVSMKQGEFQWTQACGIMELRSCLSELLEKNDKLLKADGGDLEE